MLARLARQLDAVAVISGRPSDQVRELLDVEGVEIVGTHGLEDVRPMAEEILDEIRAVAVAVGAWVEPKGATAAVHFRALEDPEAAETTSSGRLAAIAATHDLEVVPGKRILELAPAGRPRKGGAVERIATERELAAVLFAGDDVGDLDAFAALSRLRTRGTLDLRDGGRRARNPRRGPGGCGSGRRGPERGRGAARLDRRRAGAPDPRGARDWAAGPRRSPGAGWRATWPACARAPNAEGREPGACAPPPASGAPR